jgi:hypothetical protein
MKALGIAFTDWIEPFAAAENYEAFRALPCISATAHIAQARAASSSGQTPGCRSAKYSVMPGGR